MAARGGPSGKDNARSPLDFQQGAGRVRVDRSFDILTAGQQRPNQQINEEAGWDFNLPAKGTLIQTYFMTLDQAMESCEALAHRAGGSSQRVTRALVLEQPPSIAAGEITDKGTINQRAVIHERQVMVERLYAARDRSVVMLDSPAREPGVVMLS